jgi:hypothetical protein
MNRNELRETGSITAGFNGMVSHEFGHVGNLGDVHGSKRSMMNMNYHYNKGGPTFKDRWNFFRGR